MERMEDLKRWLFAEDTDNTVRYENQITIKAGSKIREALQIADKQLK